MLLVLVFLRKIEQLMLARIEIMYIFLNLLEWHGVAGLTFKVIKIVIISVQIGYSSSSSGNDAASRYEPTNLGVGLVLEVFYTFGGRDGTRA